MMLPGHSEVDRSLEASLDEIRRLVAQPSLSPTGEGIPECAELCRDLLEEHGFSAAVHPTEGNPVVVGELGSGRHTLLLYCHYDTESPGDLDEWTSPPFAAEIRDGRLYGRGTEDDKGHIVSRLAAVSAFLRTQGEPPYRIVFLIEGEEEIGSPSLPGFVSAKRDLFQADGCIWEWGTIDHQDRPVLVLGVRGYVNVELEVMTANTDLHSGLQSHIPNAAWRLVWALSTLKDRSERVLIDGFYDGASPPTASQVALLNALPDDEAGEKELYGVGEFAGGVTGDAWRKAVFTPTCTINGLMAGYQGEGSLGIIPHRALAKLDFRLVPGQNPDDVIPRLRRHLDANGFEDVAVRSAGGFRPAATVDPQLPFVKTVVASTADVYSQSPVVYPMVGGSGPVDVIVNELGTPVVVGVGIDRPGASTHGPNEHIYLAEFERGTKHMVSVLEHLAQLWG
jgi:acetylornithine deacetylase/succinyl-diaminopimelate desuccinylase-like protein